ncbi:response regulator [Nitrosomonas sp.]|uniref:response regulator n=1 Tax=Nitrosomonas sp. TaxID=42353 RepID=UPI00374D2A85
MTKTKEIEFSTKRISHNKIEVPQILILIRNHIPSGDLESILNGWEYQVTGIYNSKEIASLRMSVDKPDLILTDMVLDESDNICLDHRLNLPLENSSLRIYFTSYTTESIVRRAEILFSALGCRTNRGDSEKSRYYIDSHFNQDDDGIAEETRPAKRLSLNPIRVLLVDDQPIVLWGLENLINSQKPRMEIVGAAANIYAAKKLIMEKQPDIMILNISLDNDNCMNNISEFTNNGDTRIIIYCKTHNQKVIDQAVSCGARGVVYHKESIQTIPKVIEMVFGGEFRFALSNQLSCPV